MEDMCLSVSFLQSRCTPWRTNSLALPGYVIHPCGPFRKTHPIFRLAAFHLSPEVSAQWDASHGGKAEGVPDSCSVLGSILSEADPLRVQDQSA